MRIQVERFHGLIAHERLVIEPGDVVDLKVIGTGRYELLVNGVTRIAPVESFDVADHPVRLERLYVTGSDGDVRLLDLDPPVTVAPGQLLIGYNIAFVNGEPHHLVKVPPPDDWIPSEKSWRAQWQ